MAHCAPLNSHHLRTVSASFGFFSCSLGETTKSTARLAPAAWASSSSSSSFRSLSASSRARRSSSSASSPASEGAMLIPPAMPLVAATSSIPNGNCVGPRAGSSRSSRSSWASSSRFMRSFQTFTISSPHISFRAAITMETSLPVSPQTMLGPRGIPNCSFSSRPRTPEPLSKARPEARGKSSMSVPVSCMSSMVPSGSSSSLTCRTAAMNLRLSGSGTVPAGSLRAIVTSPNFRCNPEPIPKNFILPGCEQRARIRRCNSSTNSRCSCCRSAASTTRCVFKSKYSRPFDPVYVNSPRGATQSSIKPSADGRPPSGAAVTKTACSTQ
mmetsp:Transcript_65902/g.137602  ORF Transcript_65902/g.137602 Transcript_65902/m.137602 type:complete len:327 (-) Transcript_65902:392-1372(-)